MTENKRFTVDDSGYVVIDNNSEKAFMFDTIEDCYACCDLLNEQYETIQQLKQNNNALIRFLENQSIIIQKLHSKLLEYQLKEPIVLTKEDLEIMGKAISYYLKGDIE